MIIFPTLFAADSGTQVGFLTSIHSGIQSNRTFTVCLSASVPRSSHFQKYHFKNRNDRKMWKQRERHHLNMI